MKVSRFNLGYGLVTLSPIPGTSTVQIFADRACIQWRGHLEIEDNQLLALVDPRTGAASFDEQDEFDVLYRTRQHVAKRMVATSVHSDVHAHWFIELLNTDTKQRFIFTAEEWNALLASDAIIGS